MKLSKLLTSRLTVLILFITISGALLVASSVPQRTATGGKPPAWVERLPENLYFFSNLLGLDNIVGSTWFAALVALFWASLVVSAIAQFTAARTLVRRMPPVAVPTDSIRIDCTPDAFSKLVNAAGYRLTGKSDGVHRYVKNRIGYWGNFLLHIGLVASVLFSLVYVVTKHRVLVRLTGQEITRLTPENVQEISGVLPLRQKLPYTVLLNALVPRFWGNDKLERLSSELYFTDRSGGEPQRVDVALSDKSHYGSYIVYQSNTYGRMFDLTLESAREELRRERFFLPYPSHRDTAAYGEMPVSRSDYLLKGKYYADAEHKTMTAHDSPLTLRLYRGEELLGETTLTLGAPGQLGPFTVTLVQSEWWTDILLDGTHGTAGIFTGFALILAGVLSSYCLVPREIMLWDLNGEIRVQRMARKFSEFYREEFNDIIQKVEYRNDQAEG